MLTGENGILTQAKKAKEETKEVAIEEENRITDYEDYISKYTNGGYVESKGVNAPVLGENMKLISYNVETKTWEENNSSSSYDYVAGEETADNNKSKWANAKVTLDGIDSYFVWIPRYAYRITSGYHQSGTDTTGGTIEIKFLKGTTDEFLDGSGTAETDPSKITYTEDSQDQWLVHPAFTDVEENGGWDTQLEGIWVGKFETTGGYIDGDASKVTVKPGENSLVNMKINKQYKAGKSATFGEASSELIGSHMAKNSEWGAVAYLSQSSYGLNGKEIERNTNSYYTTGGSSTKATIYTTNAGQSTTGNAYGVYDMSGGTAERIASYVNYSSDSFNTDYTGNTAEDIYNASNPGESSKYKTVYEASGTDRESSYNLAAGKKGDGVYETSNNYQNSNSWFGAYSNFPNTSIPFFYRGGRYYDGGAGVFYFNYNDGSAYPYTSFRVVLGG